MKWWPALLLLLMAIGCGAQSEQAADRDAAEINQRIKDAGGDVPDGAQPRD